MKEAEVLGLSWAHLMFLVGIVKLACNRVTLGLS